MAMFLSLLIAFLSFHQTADHREHIESLLEKLKPSAIENLEEHIVTLGPTSETITSVRAELMKLAAESAETRSQVIEILIKVVKDKPVEVQAPYDTDYKWTMAVNLLGDLRAMEAINALVENLDQTGEFRIITSIHYRPVTSALRKIGDSAVPQLIKALSDKNPYIRTHAVSTLIEIGDSAFTRLEDALRNTNANTRGGAGQALAWIGGKDARTAIERAIAREKDKGALKKLRYALEVVRNQ